MMRQTKQGITTWSVAAVLAVGLIFFGCSRQTESGSGNEHMNENTMHQHADESGNSDASGGPAHSEAGEDGDHHMDKTNENSTPTGILAEGVRTIEVKARKFEFDPARIVVKQGEKVRLRVTSEDVTHGISISAYDIDRKLPPNETQTIEFSAEKAGEFHFHCSVYCGSGHSDMHGELVVLKQ